MLHSAVGIIRDVKTQDSGKGYYTVDFKDPDGNIHSTKSWVMNEIKYATGDSIAIRYRSFKIFGKTIIITDRIDDKSQNKDKIAISGAGVAALIGGAVATLYILHVLHKKRTGKTV